MHRPHCQWQMNFWMWHKAQYGKRAGSLLSIAILNNCWTLTQEKDRRKRSGVSQWVNPSYCRSTSTSFRSPLLLNKPLDIVYRQLSETQFPFVQSSLLKRWNVIEPLPHQNCCYLFTVPEEYQILKSKFNLKIRFYLTVDLTTFVVRLAKVSHPYQVCCQWADNGYPRHQITSFLFTHT